MQHRMLQEAQKAMAPWMHGQPIYAPISSNASSQGVPILHSGEWIKVQSDLTLMFCCIILASTQGRMFALVSDTEARCSKIKNLKLCKQYFVSLFLYLYQANYTSCWNAFVLASVNCFIKLLKCKIPLCFIGANWVWIFYWLETELLCSAVGLFHMKIYS